MEKRWVELRVVTGAVKVFADTPLSNDMFFLVLLPEEHDDTVERHGITYKEYRVPHRIFKEAIAREFPYTAEVQMVTRPDYRRPKIERFKIL